MEKDTLKKFQKKIVTRPLKIDDFDQLVELQHRPGCPGEHMLAVVAQ